MSLFSLVVFTLQSFIYYFSEICYNTNIKLEFLNAKLSSCAARDRRFGIITEGFMKDAIHHLKHLQKKVLQSVKKEDRARVAEQQKKTNGMVFDSQFSNNESHQYRFK